MKYSFRGVATICALSVFVACAGGQLAKIESSDFATLPPGDTGDLKEKFEIKETLDLPPPPPPAPNPAPFPESASAKKKSKRKEKKTAQPLPPTPPLAKDEAGPPPLPPFEWPKRRPTKDPLWLGEQLVYDISYFGVSAGEFTMAVEGYKTINGRKVYHTKGVAISSSVFSVFYRLNDMVESFLDYEGLFSHRFHIVLDETKQTRDSLELNDSEKSQTYYWNRWNHKTRGYSEVKEFKPIPRFPQDSMSAMYYLRMILPISDGQMVTFPVVSEGKYWDAEITALRREEFNSPALGKVRTIVLKPETKYQGILQKRGDSFLWFTEDEHKYMVKMEAKVKIGTVHATLKRIIPGTPPPVE